VQDQIGALLDLAAVHSFFLSVFEQVTGESVPALRDYSATSPPDLAHAISVQRRWVRVLDLAITPAMFRDALRDTVPHEVAQALLRYYIVKESHNDVDRDKADFLSTFLYRHPPSWRKREALPGPSEDYHAQFASQKALEYEGELYSFLGDLQPVALADEHYQLAKEFEHLYYEVEEFRHFDQLVDSAITGRVRELKQRFGESFYHPRVLSTVAVYNAFFGQRFDELFHKTTEELRAFAKKVEADGGSIMSRVDGDVLVKDLATVEDTQILNADYGHAKEQFRKVSRFKKAIDTRRSGRAAAAKPALSPPSPPPPPPAPAAAAPRGASSTTTTDPVLAFSPVQPLASYSHDSLRFQRNEEHKTTAMEDIIYNFVRVADAGAANVVPLRHGNLLLSAHEMDAFRNGFHGEKSFRGDFTAKLRHLVALQARLIVELEDFSRARGSEYLWKPHADAIKFVITAGNKAIAEGEALAETAGKRGLADKVRAMTGSTTKLRQQMQVCARALQA
jgi:hypothetical protein